MIGAAPLSTLSELREAREQRLKTIESRLTRLENLVIAALAQGFLSACGIISLLVLHK